MGRGRVGWDGASHADARSVAQRRSTAHGALVTRRYTVNSSFVANVLVTMMTGTAFALVPLVVSSTSTS